MTGEPYIPETITVHLGTPDSSAQNVTVSFPDYIKNVASSEIYPTWPENAIRANVYAQISYALNRVYTEWYRSRGYDFDITNSTRYDQAFVQNRDIYDNVSDIVDEIFNNYVRRQGSVEPYFTQYCNGTTVTCDGLSQWGTVPLAEQGYTPYQILTNYYGDDIEIVTNAPVRINAPSYPGVPLRIGDAGNDVRSKQIQLNRISNNYPAIPKIYPVDGVFGQETEDAVKEFQRIFNLAPDGVIGKQTWYRIAYLYTSVKRLSELNSEGIPFEDVELQYSTLLRYGDRGFLRDRPAGGCHRRLRRSDPGGRGRLSENFRPGSGRRGRPPDLAGYVPRLPRHHRQHGTERYPGRALSRHGAPTRFPRGIRQYPAGISEFYRPELSRNP